MDPDRLIPGPDPGACPRCGEWLKAGMTHRCEGGEARNHEADIHAVALRAFHRALDLDDAHMDDAVRAAMVAALDAVRRSPQETCGTCGGERDKPALMSDDSYSEFPCPSPFHRRSPQGEDHKAGIDIAEDAYQRLVAAGFTPKTADGMLRAYLSRCPSPERDTELEAVRRELSEAGIFNPGEPLGSQVWRLRTRADVAMAEVERLRSSPERDTEKLLAFGREHGIAALLDHLGLDELGNEVSRLVEALFEAKGAIPSDRGELHRRLGRILSEFSDASKDSRVSPDHDPGRTD
jgi:hypothetical protein